MSREPYVKKELISAHSVRQAHAAGCQRLPAHPLHFVITPEAHSVAQRLGVLLDPALTAASPASALPQASNPPAPASTALAATAGAPAARGCAPCASPVAPANAGAIAAIRAQVMARIPPGSIREDQLDRIIVRAMALTSSGPSSTAASAASAAAAAANAAAASPQAPSGGRSGASLAPSTRSIPPARPATAAGASHTTPRPTTNMPVKLSDLVESSLAWCRQHPRSVVFPDALDERALHAAAQLVEARALRPVLLGDVQRIQALARTQAIPLTQIEIVDPAKAPAFEAYADALFERLSAKGTTREAARELLRDPLYFGAMMVRRGDADCCVAGNLASTASVLKAALRVIGPAQGMKTVSSVFLMVPPTKGRPLAFSDCSVVPEPTVEQLADIAISSAASFANLTGQQPRVAMLSFSTRGSVQHPAVEQVAKATELVRSRCPDLLVEGELQFDAAFVPEVAARKLPGSQIAGQANVFVFPNLSAGNIGYKIAERLGGYSALGPLIQGLDAPMHDLSRGCSAKDMFEVPLLAAKMAFGGGAG